MTWLGPVTQDSARGDQSLPLVQRCTKESAYGQIEGPYYEVVQEGRILIVKRLHARCEQKLAAFWRPGIVGTWKTLGSVFIQPAVMRPTVVARCDCLYAAAIELPGDASIAALRVFQRGDAYASPTPRFAEIPALAILHRAP